MTPFRPSFIESRGRSFRESPGKARLLDPCLSGPGEVPLAQVTLGDVTVWELTQDFGGGESYDAGDYIVRYCGGFWGDNISTDTVAVTTTHVGQEEWNFGYRIFVAYNGGSATATFNESKPSAASLPPAVIEANASGIFTAFHHTGGKIRLVFTDMHVNDNWVTDSMPVFTLYRVQPYLIAVGACVDRTGDDAHFRGVFTVFNKCRANFTDLTATLLSSGGVGTVISPATFNISARSNRSFEIEFDPTTTGDTTFTASVEIEYNGSVVQTLTFELSPALVAGSDPSITTGGMCIVPCHQVNLFIENIGSVTTMSPVATVSATWLGGECTLRHPLTCDVFTAFNLPRMAACGSSLYVVFFIVVAGGPQSGDVVTITISISDGALTHPDIVWHLTVP